MRSSTHTRQPSTDCGTRENRRSFRDQAWTSGYPMDKWETPRSVTLSLGSGRIIYQSITRIDQAIKDGSFNTNTAYTAAIDSAVSAGGAIHVMGLLSPGGVHSHEAHIFAALRLARARGATRIYLHAFLDGRDMPPRSAAPLAQARRPGF